MKIKINQFAVSIYTILFGIFGFRDFYFARYCRGLFRFIALIASTLYFSTLQTILRIKLSHQELVDNLYVPAMTGANAALYNAFNIIAAVLLVACVIWWLYDLYIYFVHKEKTTTLSVSKKRFLTNAFLLGWTGIHDYLIGRDKYANTHVILLITTIALIAVSRIKLSTPSPQYQAFMSIALILGVAIFIANELIAVIEAFNYLFNKHEQGKTKK